MDRITRIYLELIELRDKVVLGTNSNSKPYWKWLLEKRRRKQLKAK